MEAVGDDSEGSDKDRSNGAGPGPIHKAVAQSVLLYGSEIGVVTGEMLKVLEGFHH